MAARPVDNKKLLDDFNRTRQMMMKNSSINSRPNPNAEPQQQQPTTMRPPVMNGMDMQSSITFVPTNSQYGNNILPIIPRISAD